MHKRVLLHSHLQAHSGGKRYSAIPLPYHVHLAIEAHLSQVFNATGEQAVQEAELLGHEGPVWQVWLMHTLLSALVQHLHSLLLVRPAGVACPLAVVHAGKENEERTDFG